MTLSDDIAPQPLTQALTQFANQTGVQFAYRAEIAAAQVSKGARRGASAEDALVSLLDGTGLRFEFLNDRTVTIIPMPAAGPTPSATTTPDRRTRGRADSWTAALAEVVVTATRRKQHVDEVPISMAVLTEAEMERAGIKGMAEIGALTPGVEFDFTTNLAGDIYTQLTIRGVKDRHGATTGFFIDDVPVPPIRAESFGRSFPWTFDLARVEILRGPQSTMLGAGTLAGAFRFIFNQPSLDTFSSVVHTEWATTERGDASYEAGAAGGGPLITDVLGFRASGWYRSEGGYVDHVNPFTGASLKENANRLISKSARAALLWAPVPAVRIVPSLTYGSFNQSDPSSFDVSMSDPARGVLRIGNLESQPAEDWFYLGSLDLTADLGFAELNSVTAYYDHTGSLTIDWTSTDPLTFDDAVAMPFDVEQAAFSQEARLTSADPGAAITWTAGAFYSNERKRESTSVVQGAELIDAKSTLIEQTQVEAFGQLGFRLRPRLTLTGGVRIGRSEYDGTKETAPTAHVGAIETSITPRFDLTYRMDDVLFYLTAAEGYRSGDVDPPIATCTEEPMLLPADTLWSYEVGAKAGLLHGRLRVEPSVFYMHWHNDQPDAIFSDVCTLTALRSSAASEGFDLLIEALVTDRLKVGLALAYTDAHYTQTVRTDGLLVISNGDAVGSLPLVTSPWNITASIDYLVHLSSDFSVELAALDIFHGRNHGPFAEENPASAFYSPDDLPDPATNVLNLRMGLHWPNFDVALYADNALDAQPILGVGSMFARTFRPRTIGVSATWRL